MLHGEELHVMTITGSALSEFHNRFFILLNIAVAVKLAHAQLNLHSL